MSAENTVILRQIENFHFESDFGGGLQKYSSDEPAPLGTGKGPSPIQLLLAAVGSCMSSSLHFAMGKFHEVSGPIVTTATASIGRDENKNLRVEAIEIAISFGLAAGTISHLEQVIGQFERFCTVGASVARGIPIHVSVIDGNGLVVKPGSSK
jgi:uncharacterized OsmC-like protein